MSRKPKRQHPRDAAKEATAAAPTRVTVYTTDLEIARLAGRMMVVQVVDGRTVVGRM